MAAAAASSGSGATMSTLLPLVGGRNGWVCVLWCLITVQLRLDPASCPSSGSVALPTRWIVWPTAKRNDAPGASIDGAGGELPASMRTVAGCEASPWLSTAVTDAV